MQELPAKMEVAGLVFLVESGVGFGRIVGSVMDNGSNSEMVGGIVSENGSRRNRVQQCGRRCSL
jgi:hypothetical protein